MTVLNEILALSEQVADDKLANEVTAVFESAYTASIELVTSLNEGFDADQADTAVAVMAVECVEVAETEAPTDLQGKADAIKLAEAVDTQYKADVELLESLSDETIVGLNDLLAESFEQAVQRILKSDRKLRMKDKDGKPYKNRRRAAEAAVGASMRAVFGKKGMARKAAAGKKG